MLQYITPYKNGLVNFPLEIRKMFAGKHIELEVKDGEVVLRPVTHKPSRVFEDKEGKITEYENGDFDVEFKEGLTLESFQDAVKELAEELV